MSKYILIYETNKHSELGGGIKIEYPKTEAEMHDRAEELFNLYPAKMTILEAGHVNLSFKYNPIKYAVKLEPIRT